MATFSTPFANKLGTNDILSSQDRDHLRDLLLQPQERLAQLDAKLSERERALDTLKQERNILEDQIQLHMHSRLLLSPIRRLPDDILREIFLACLPDAHNAVMDCKVAPLLLGLVCSHWRLVAYSAPRLWATLHIPYPTVVPRKPETLFDIYGDRLEKHRAAVRDWLTRSGSCPLSLAFLVPLDSVYRLHEMTLTQSYLPIMLHFSQRWHSLELNINLPGGTFSSVLTSIPTTSMPILTRLHLKFARATMSTAEAEEWITSGLLNAPRLRTLDIICIPFSPTHLGVNTLANLSSLSLMSVFHERSRFCTIQDAYIILSRCSRLVHCALTVYGGSDDPIPTDVISLPFLKSLRIIEACRSISTLFERFATLPALRGISYHTKDHPSDERQFPVITLLTRINQITYLELILLVIPPLSPRATSGQY